MEVSPKFARVIPGVLALLLRALRDAALPALATEPAGQVDRHHRCESITWLHDDILPSGVDNKKVKSPVILREPVVTLPTLETEPGIYEEACQD